MKYLLFHKPLDVVCRFGGDEPCLGDYIDVPDVYPVGRLDADSEGLVLLTDDGPLQHRLSEPRFKQPKVYLVCVEGTPAPAHMQALEEGLIVGGHPARAAAARILSGPPPLPERARPIRVRRSIPVAWLEITLTAGRNRQVRRMTAAVGLPTLRLVRVRIGPCSIEGLDSGTWRWLTADEVRNLRETCGLDKTERRQRRFPPRQDPQDAVETRDRRNPEPPAREADRPRRGRERRR